MNDDFVEKIDVQIAVSRLPLLLKKIYYLYFEMEYSQLEIGEKLGIPQRTVSSHVTKIKKLVKEYLLK